MNAGGLTGTKAFMLLVHRRGGLAGLKSIPLLGWHGVANLELATRTGGARFASGDTR